MTSIADLADIHLLEPNQMFRNLREKLRLNYLSFFRTLDARLRRVRLLRALRQTLAQKPDHVVITGDLIEDGNPTQFEVLADTLFAAGVRPGQVTLVPCGRSPKNIETTRWRSWWHNTTGPTRRDVARAGSTVLHGHPSASM